MKFFVNSFDDREKGSGGHVILFGLFDSNEWVGEGHFCGWYGGEYYTNVNLLAYVLTTGPNILHSNYRLSPVIRTHEHFDKLSIYSGISERSFEADSVEEAIQVFRDRSYLREDD